MLNMHTCHSCICGENPDGDERYGIPVVCNIFLKSIVYSKLRKRKKKRELLPKFQVFTTTIS